VAEQLDEIAIDAVRAAHHVARILVVQIAAQVNVGEHQEALTRDRFIRRWSN
jgi:hypothetical protein